MSSGTSDGYYSQAYLDENRGYQLQVTSAVFGFLAVASVLGRVAARIKNKVRFGIDDYLIVAAGVVGVGLVVEQCLVAHYGTGRHVQAVTPSMYSNMFKVSFAFQICQPTCLALAKLSILALYYRIFGKVNKAFVWAIWGLAVYITLWWIGIILGDCLECQPLASIWEDGCAPSHAMTISTGVLNVVSDFAVFLLPQPIIWNLQMPLRHKLGVSFVLMLGLFATVISIVRIPISLEDGNNGNTDITWGLVPTNVFAILEPLVAIICACLPVMQVFFRQIGSSWMNSRMFQSLQTMTSSRRGLTRNSDGSKDFELESAGQTWNSTQATTTTDTAPGIAR